MICRFIFFQYLILSLIIVSPLELSAKDGNSVGNGGGATALQFTSTARKALQFLKSMNLDSETRMQVVRIEQAVNTARVGSARVVLLNGLEVDGKNDPIENHILVSRTGWQRMKKRPVATRVGFALHEYALVAGLDDHNYAISNALVSLLRDDRTSDDSQQENVLSRFAEIRRDFRLAEHALLASGPQENFDLRTICRLSGLIRGAALMLETTELVTNWNLTATSNLTRNQLKTSIDKFDRACASGTMERTIHTKDGLDLVRDALRPLDAILR